LRAGSLCLVPTEAATELAARENLPKRLKSNFEDTGIFRVS